MSRSGISYEKEESSESDTGESEITEIKFKEEMSKEEEEEVIMSNIDRPKLVRIWAAEREGDWFGSDHNEVGWALQS